MRIRSLGPRALPAILAVLFLAPAGVDAGPATALAVPRREAPPTLDGRLDEPAWDHAASLAVAPVTVRSPAGEPQEIAPAVRVLAAGGRLWLGIEASEDAGPGIGFVAMVAAKGAADAADAVSLAYTPQDPRAPRYVARGPKGAGRGAVRIVAAADLASPGAWSVEAAIPLADLGVATPDARLRLAVAVRTRDPRVITWAPPDAAFADPPAWTLLEPTGGWPLEGALPDGDALAKEDAEDARCVQAWRRFVAATQLALEDMLPEDSDALQGEGDPVAVREAARRALLGPLDTVLGIRPDLAMAHVQRAEILAGLGDDDGARAALDRAEAAVPGLREARASRALDVEGPALASAPVGEPSDYDAAFARVAEAAKAAADDPFALDGVRFAEGLLRYRHGDADAAMSLLDPLARRYPSRAAVVRAARRARDAQDRASREMQYRRQDHDLPRVRFETSRGSFTVELYEDDHPNTAHNLVWLAQKGFFDGRGVDGTVPYFGVLLGAASPGYAIPTEREARRQRAPLRGALVMGGDALDTEAAAFLVLTGTALHLEGEFVVFGRVVEGQDVVDRLARGDGIVAAEATNLRAGVSYRPDTVAGGPAPEPPPPK